MSKSKLFYDLQDYILLKTSVEKALLKLRSSKTYPLTSLEQELSGLFAKGERDPKLSGLVRDVKSAIEERDRERTIGVLEGLKAKLDEIIQETFKKIQG